MVIGGIHDVLKLNAVRDEDEIMAMPRDLVFVRHGESVGNVARRAERKGDESLFTPEFQSRPDSRWPLTERGIEQAKCAGQFILKRFGRDAFDRYYHSPYVRPRQTAGYLGQIAAPNARWALDRRLREREWGDLGTMPAREYAERYPENLARKERDSLYWAPVAGESIADVSNRFRDFLGTMHLGAGGQRVLVACHGEMMWITRLVLEYMSDEEWVESEEDKSQKIKNAAVLHYTNTNPENGDVSRHLHWVSLSRTWEEDESGLIVPTYEPGPWKYFEKPLLSNEQLHAIDGTS